MIGKAEIASVWIIAGAPIRYSGKHFKATTFSGKKVPLEIYHAS
jgi:hypothetical protein